MGIRVRGEHWWASFLQVILQNILFQVDSRNTEANKLQDEISIRFNRLQVRLGSVGLKRPTFIWSLPPPMSSVLRLSHFGPEHWPKWFIPGKYMGKQGIYLKYFSIDQLCFTIFWSNIVLSSESKTLFFVVWYYILQDQIERMRTRSRNNGNSEDNTQVMSPMHTFTDLQ